jgi:hypothetical protein
MYPTTGLSLNNAFGGGIRPQNAVRRQRRVKLTRMFPFQYKFSQMGNEKSGGMDKSDNDNTLSLLPGKKFLLTEFKEVKT